VRSPALFLLLAALPAAAFQDPHITPEMDKHLLAGIDGIYNMRFDEAEAAARKAIELNPEHPNAYMGLAGILWTKYVYGTDQTDQSLIKPFDEAIEKTIAVSKAWLKKHPKEPMGLMTLGAAYGVSSRLMVIRHQWLSAYWTGRKAVNITKDAVKANPELWDAYLGLGMYDYYTDVYPRFIGVLAKIVLRGNRLRGIETLKMVAEKGHYSKNNAMILLVEIYTEDQWGAKDPEKALEIIKVLRAKYPNSAMMHSAYFVCLYQGGRYEEAAKSAEDYVARAKAGKYNAIELGKGYVALGTALWALKQHDAAREAFAKAQEVQYQGKMSRWAVWAHIREGNLQDALGKREEAVKHYKIAVGQPDLWGFKAQAKNWISAPFRSIFPGPIPPGT
jgi:tetratricopeptide (TPR) repeat protein